MQITIQIIRVDVSQKPTKNGGTYGIAEVTYKQLDGTKAGSVALKKIMSFTVPTVFETLKIATQDQVYQIGMEKNGQYWDWKTAVLSTGSIPSAPANVGAVGSKAAQPVKSTYETAEERATRQVLIVRQSCLAQAVALSSIGMKSIPKTDEVLEIAQELVDWVFQNEAKVAAPATLDDMDNDEIN